MINIEPIEQATTEFLNAGLRVMNAFLLADTEQAHAAKLLALMEPPPGACIVDAGCGIGELAKLMQAERPDLSFKLLNLSAMQLAHCPQDMALIEADFDKMPLADESVDVVMFSFAICHSDDWLKTLLEARRVLREGGVLFIYDMARQSGDNVLMKQVLQAAAHPSWAVVDVARRAGFVLDEALGFTPTVSRLRDLMPGSYEMVVGDVVPATWRFTRQTVDGKLASALARHERIAFQFSGGRDSTAALYLLRQFWGQMTVYHLDTGDQFPETIEVVRQVEADLGKPIVRIQSDVQAVRRDHGLASDLVPVDNTEIGRMVSGRKVKLISRYECCAKSLMLPMHARILQDGVTLLIRGQRDDEYAVQPKRSGDIEGGLELLYPIQDWTGERVQSYLVDNRLPIAPYYERGARRAPECMGCTAWWDEGRASYLKQYHPDKYTAYQANMKVIRIEIDHQYQHLED
jgi:3'-phosphoadenosine 5'-phosphosulfate sulfotransferase (PAPS reductase)/FAD synthetase/ubiquinone/menaquinone biosynthesis C-methylase UbiE